MQIPGRESDEDLKNNMEANPNGAGCNQEKLTDGPEGLHTQKR